MTPFEMLLNGFGGMRTLSLDQASRVFNDVPETLARKIDAGDTALRCFRLDERRTAVRLGALMDLATRIDGARGRAAGDLSRGAGPRHSFAARRRRALPMTETEDRLIAAAATTGERRTPNRG